MKKMSLDWDKTILLNIIKNKCCSAKLSVDLLSFVTFSTLHHADVSQHKNT